MSQGDYLKRKKISTEINIDHETNHPAVYDSKDFTGYLSYSLGNNINNTNTQYNKILPDNIASIFDIEWSSVGCVNFECFKTDLRPNRVPRDGDKFSEHPHTWDEIHNSTFDKKSCCPITYFLMTYVNNNINYLQLTPEDIYLLEREICKVIADDLNISKDGVIINLSPGSLKIKILISRNESYAQNKNFIDKRNTIL